MPTRYHPWNLAKQNRRCNRYDGGRFEFGAAIDRQYGRGTAAFLERLSRKIKPWTTEELGTLRAAAKMGFQTFEQTYFMLRPHHRLVRKVA
jgi:hypothetical protein